MTQHRWLFLTLAAAWACSRPSFDPPKDERSAFQVLSEGIGFDPPCSREIPKEWAASLPVPALRGGSLHYRVFFYGWAGRPDTKLVTFDAQGMALFAADGQVIECRRHDDPRREIPNEALPAGTRAEYDGRLRSLYVAIEKMGGLFVEGGTLSPDEKSLVASFAAEFSALSARGHAASYRALSPEFWAWVKRNGGKAP